MPIRTINQAKTNHAEPAHKAIALVVPHHPREKTVERHCHHGVPRGEAVARLGYEAKAFRPGPLNKLLEQYVERHGAYQVNSCADAWSASRRKRFHGQQHDEKNHRPCELRDRLHVRCEPRLAERLNKEQVCARVKFDELALAEFLQKPYEHERSRCRKDETKVFSHQASKIMALLCQMVGHAESFPREQIRRADTGWAPAQQHTSLNPLAWCHAPPRHAPTLTGRPRAPS